MPPIVWYFCQTVSFGEPTEKGGEWKDQSWGLNFHTGRFSHS